MLKYIVYIKKVVINSFCIWL